MKKLLPNSVKNSYGFTLVELLVVITIIAILAVVGISAFSSAQKTARDGRRKSDIDSIAKAYEASFSPTTGAYTDPTASSFASNTPPSDPGSNSYANNTVNSAKGFWACATLEVSTGNASDPGGASDTSTYPTFVTTNTGSMYCVASQQSK